MLSNVIKVAFLELTIFATNSCTAFDIESPSFFKECKKNTLHGENETEFLYNYTQGVFLLDGERHNLKIWENESGNQMRFNDSGEYIAFNDIGAIGGGVIWSGIYEGKRDTDGYPPEGIFYRKNGVVQHVYKSSGGKLVVGEHSVIVLSHNSEQHSSSGELIFLDLVKNKLIKTKSITLPGKPAGIVFLGEEKYIISGYKDNDTTWAFILFEKENIKNLECGKGKSRLYKN